MKQTKQPTIHCPTHGKQPIYTLSDEKIVGIICQKCIKDLQTPIVAEIENNLEEYLKD